ADGTPATSPGLVWSAQLKRFVQFAGLVAHDFTGKRPYDVQSFDPARGRWTNDLPAGAADRGEETGPVTNPGFNTPYFSLKDRQGVARPQPYQSPLWYQYAIAPWDGRVYALI